MPAIELTDPDFKDELLISGFNNEGSLAYFLSVHTYYLPSMQWTMQWTVTKEDYKLFRISRFGESVHKIGEIEIPGISHYTYDIEKEKIIWLGRVYDPPLDDLTAGNNCLLTLVTFGVSSGILERYYHITQITHEWSLIRPDDDLILAYPWHSSHDSLQIYAVSHMDPTNGTFQLSPYVKLPFYDYLLSIYQIPFLLASSVGQITVYNFPIPAHILYFKTGSRKWILENYISVRSEENFQLCRSYCVGPRIVEWMTNGNETCYRFLTADQNHVWKLVFQITGPPDMRNYQVNPSRCTSDGKLVMFGKFQNCTLEITILTCVLDTLLEACIRVLWRCSRKANPQLTDYHISDRLGLSKYVSMDTYFGKKFND